MDDTPEELNKLEEITPTNEEWREIAKKNPPPDEWLSGDEERPF